MRRRTTGTTASAAVVLALAASGCSGGSEAPATGQASSGAAATSATQGGASATGAPAGGSTAAADPLAPAQAPPVRLPAGYDAADAWAFPAGAVQEAVPLPLSDAVAVLQQGADGQRRVRVYGADRSVRWTSAPLGQAPGATPSPAAAGGGSSPVPGSSLVPSGEDGFESPEGDPGSYSSPSPTGSAPAPGGTPAG